LEVESIPLTVMETVGSVAEGVGKVKALVQSGQASPGDFRPASVSGTAMAPFRPRMQDPYAGGHRWMGQLQRGGVPERQAWVPQETADALGIDLTGLRRRP
jgi:hypothetical protein